ncbi:hypothetical protein [Spongiibacter marinus]|uniref:hypothetical protein n=1 Tax=Spongiibacter marinus TaxID=354246 RepID=UPI00356ADDC0
MSASLVCPSPKKIQLKLIASLLFMAVSTASTAETQGDRIRAEEVVTERNSAESPPQNLLTKAVSPSVGAAAQRPIASSNNLELELDALNRHVESQNILFTTFLTAIGLLITLVGLVFPLMTYFLNIRPAQETLKEARATIEHMEKRFAELLSQNRRGELDKTIKTLQSSNPIEAPFAATALQIGIINQKPTESQIAKIVNIARDTENDLVRSSIIQLLAFHKSQPISTFYKELALDSGQLEKHKVTIGQYLIASGDKKVWSAVKKTVSVHPNPLNILMAMIRGVMAYDDSAAKQFLDDSELVLKLGPGTRRDFLRSLLSSGQTLEIVKNSCLENSITDPEAITIWSTTEGGEVEVQKLEKADLVIIYEGNNKRDRIKHDDPDFHKKTALYNPAV